MFDKTFAKVMTTGGFTDSTLPAGYAPFGIQALTVERHAADLRDVRSNAAHVGRQRERSRPRHRERVRRAGHAGDAPDCGRRQAERATGVLRSHQANFGTYSNNLLVGNFGDGVINAYDVSTGAFVGALADSNGTAFANPGLWGIGFGNGAQNQPATTLYFAAGIANEAAGLYGRIDLGATAARHRRSDRDADRA